MADPVSAADVRHVAALARLQLSDTRVEALTRDLNAILEHMRVVSSVTAAQVETLEAPGPGMPLRRDEGPPMPLTEPLASLAATMRDGFFIVPRLASHEEPESSA